MKFLIGILSFVFLFFAPVMLFAQTTTTLAAVQLPPDQVVQNTDFLQFLILSLGGAKGLGTLGIVALVVQAALKFLATPLAGQVFKNFSGFGRWLTVSVLTVVGGVIALMMPPNNLSLSAALLHSGTLTAVMVYLNQGLQQWKKV